MPWQEEAASMVADTAVFCYTKKFGKTGQGHFCVVSKGTRRSQSNTWCENDVLTGDELVVARGFLRESRYGCLYMWNEYPRGFRLLNHAWGAYFKWAK